MFDLSGILGALHQGVADNRSAFMGAGAALMSGPMHTAAPAFAQAMQRGALVDQARRKAQLEQIEKARLQEMQMRQAQQAGLDPVWAGTSLPGAVMADRLSPKAAKAKGLSDYLTPEEMREAARRQYLGEGKGSPTEGYTPYQHTFDDGTTKTMFRSKDSTDIKSYEELTGKKPPGGAVGGVKMTTAQQNDLAKSETLARDLFQSIDRHRELVRTHGAEVEGPGKQTLLSSISDIQTKIRLGAEMGVLNKHDIPVIEKMFPDPTVDITSPSTYSNAYRIGDRTKAAAAGVKEKVLRELNNKRTVLGLPPVKAEELGAASPFGAPATGGASPATDPFAGVTIRQVR